MNRDIDQTREKLGVGELNTQQRKKLFEEFVDHGGQVIEEKKPKDIIRQPSTKTRAKPKEREAKIEPKKKPAAEFDRKHGRDKAKISYSVYTSEPS